MHASPGRRLENWFGCVVHNAFKELNAFNAFNAFNVQRSTFNAFDAFKVATRYCASYKNNQPHQPRHNMSRLAQLEAELSQLLATLQAHQALHGEQSSCNSRRGCGTCAELAYQIQVNRKKLRKHVNKLLDEAKHVVEVSNQRGL
jgi:hypothetical protein